MITIDSIRKHTKITVGIFVICCVAFVIQEFAYAFFGGNNKNDDKETIATVNGDKIMLGEFKRRLEAVENNVYNKYKISFKDTFWGKYFRDSTLTEMINEKAYAELSKSMGILVSRNELIDIVQGDNIDDEIKGIFIDDDKKVFDKDKLIEHLKKVAQSDIMAEQWSFYEDKLRKSRCQKRINELAKRSTYCNHLEFERVWKEDNSSIDVEGTIIPYSVIQDDKCNLTTNAIQKWINGNKKKYMTDEKYEIRYFIVPFEPSENDIETSEKELQKLQIKFKTSNSPIEFAKVKSNCVDSEDRYNDKRGLIVISEDLLPDELKREKLKIRDTKYVLSKDIKKPHKIYRVMNVTHTMEGNKYEMVVLSRAVLISDKTKSILLKVMNEKAVTFSRESFEKYAADGNYEIKEKSLEPNDEHIDGIDDARGLVRHIFNNKPMTGRVFASNAGNGVCMFYIYKHINKGVLNSEDITDSMKNDIIEHVKYEMIMKKILDTSCNNNVDELRKLFGSDVKFIQQNNLSFKDTTMKDIGNVNHVFNNIFFCNTGKSHPEYVEEKCGMLILNVKNISTKDHTKCKEEYNKLCEKTLRDTQDRTNNVLNNLIRKRFKVSDNKNVYF